MPVISKAFIKQSRWCHFLKYIGDIINYGYIIHLLALFPSWLATFQGWLRIWQRSTNQLKLILKKKTNRTFNTSYLKFSGSKNLGTLDNFYRKHNYICQQIWKTQQWQQDWERSVFIPISKKGNAKEYSNYHTTVLISHASMVMLKILQDRLQQHVNWELTDVQDKLDSEKA